MKQIIIPVAVLCLLLGLFLPVSAVAIDYLLVINLTIAIVLLLSVLLLEEPLKLSTLPSVLLLATLFRLMTNISTTRQLLASGTPGEIIPLVGQEVAEGSIIVGLVIFAILTLVQLMVIAKGAERVAEVSARFTLDALPGKQMSIDADVRSGLIDFNEARRKREELQIESRFYGALDGAMKFIKGDALVGIIITFINITGGIFSGILIHGLDLSASFHHYTLLTIGDGILSQLPAMLNSVAAGIMVTRVVGSRKESLSGELFQQLMSNPVVKIIIISFCLFFSILPGVPVWPFLIVALVFFGLLLSTTKPETVNNKRYEFYPKSKALIKVIFSVKFEERIGQENILVIPDKLCEAIYSRSGLLIDKPVIEFSSEQEGLCTVLLRGIEVYREVNQALTVDPLLRELTAILEKNILELIDDRLTRNLLEHYEQSIPELVTYLVPEVISVTQLTCLIKNLQQEDISVSSFDLILQTIAENAPIADKDNLLQAVRNSLKREITSKFASNMEISVITLATEIDFDFYQAVTNGEGFQNSNLDLIVTAIKAVQEQKLFPIILCSSAIRRFLYNCLEAFHLKIIVLAYEELLSEVKITVNYHVEKNETALFAT